ncbi:MAG: hypothetical protein Q8Q81_11100 [Oxalobacteraceae bacterium]|nr:hypothetical protein [Oxalobacteraceae bacterium]
MFEKNPYTSLQALAGKTTGDAMVNREVKKAVWDGVMPDPQTASCKDIL